MVTMAAHSSSIKLKDRTLWFDGDSTVDGEEITRLLTSGTSVDGLFVGQLTDDIKQYNKLVPENQQITIKDQVREAEFQWKVPEEFITLDVFEYVTDKFLEMGYREGWIKSDGSGTRESCNRAIRLSEELLLYNKMGLGDVLRVLIYIINTLTDNKIVWGVGRGSSVSSYVLYLIGVHDVDSYKYDLDISDFLRLDTE